MKSNFKGKRISLIEEIVQNIYVHTLRLANEGSHNLKRVGEENESNIRMRAPLR